MNINNVVIVGRLTRDSELNYTNSGMAVSRLGIAVNRSRKVNNQWQDEANFFDVIVWGKIAESLQPYLTKGSQIAVQGELRQNRWEKDGQSRSKVEIVAIRIQLLGSKKDNQQTQQAQQAKSVDDFEDDIPF